MDATPERPGLRVADLAQSPTGVAWDIRVGRLLRDVETLHLYDPAIAEYRREKICERLELLITMRENHDRATMR